jgi:hypothetical protein
MKIDTQIWALKTIGLILISTGILLVLIALIKIGNRPQPIIAVIEQMAEVRAAQRDCLQHSGAIFSVKTIWAGDPPIPVEYEIICDKSGVNSE